MALFGCHHLAELELDRSPSVQTRAESVRELFMSYSSLCRNHETSRRRT